MNRCSQQTFCDNMPASPPAEKGRSRRRGGRRRMPKRPRYGRDEADLYRDFELACLDNDLTAVHRMLQSRKLDPGLALVEGVPPLVLAAGRGNLELARALLGHPRTDVNLASWYGRTAIWAAASAGQADMIRLLLERDECLADLPDDDDVLPVMEAAGANPEVLLLFLETDRSPLYEKDRWGRSLVDRTLSPFGDDCLRTLLDHPRVDWERLAQVGARRWLYPPFHLFPGYLLLVGDPRSGLPEARSGLARLTLACHCGNLDEVRRCLADPEVDPRQCMEDLPPPLIVAQLAGQAAAAEEVHRRMLELGPLPSPVPVPVMMPAPMPMPFCFPALAPAPAEAGPPINFPGC